MILSDIFAMPVTNYGCGLREHCFMECLSRALRLAKMAERETGTPIHLLNRLQELSFYGWLENEGIKIKLKY